jgi:hypothetical protein
VGEDVPDPQGVADALRPQQPGEAFIALPEGIVAPDGQDDVEAP